MEVVIIGMPEMYEYSSPVELDAISGNYFAVPASVIMDTDMTEKRVTVFSFFSIYRGLNSSLFFSINNIVKWTGRQPNRHANGINSKIIQVIECLRDGGYLTLSEELDNSSCIEATLNLSKISEECDNDRFAIIYLDELKKIMDYQNPNAKDVFLNNDVILLVFTYLRMKIYRRRNKLFLEEINVDNQNNRQLDIDTRRLRSPDAYDCYYYEIAEELGLTPRTVSKAVDVLNELGLIYSESLPRIKYENKWRTDHTVFCNTYKREGNCLLISGSQYYLMEIENKKRKLNIVDNRKKKGGS
jgi:DNA-binding transcriptional ArsR family regulator